MREKRTNQRKEIKVPHPHPPLISVPFCSESSTECKELSETVQRLMVFFHGHGYEINQVAKSLGQVTYQPRTDQSLDILTKIHKPAKPSSDTTSISIRPQKSRKNTEYKLYHEGEKKLISDTMKR